MTGQLIYLKINMDIGLDGDFTLHPDTIIKSCIFYWGGYNESYPYNERGHRVDSTQKQIEICDVPVKELSWIINELRKEN